MCLTGGRRGFGANLLEDGLDDTLFNAFERLKRYLPGSLVRRNSGLARSNLSQRPTLVHERAPSGCAIELPLVPTVNVHYLIPEAASLQRTVSAIRLNTTLEKLPAEACAYPGSYLMQDEALIEAPKRLPHRPTRTAAGDNRRGCLSLPG